MFSSHKRKYLLEDFERRSWVLFLFFLGVVSLLVFRLWSLQFAERENYLRLAQRNYLRTVIEPALRGRIFDRKGRLLAENVPVYDMVINWMGVPRTTREKSIQRLSSLLDIPEDDIRTRLRNTVPSIFGDQTVFPQVDFSWVVAVREAQIPGVEVRVRPLRHYPYGQAAAHLIGYLGEISPAELKRFEDYRMGEWVGKMGVERRYEFDIPVLKGKDGYRQIQVYANGMINSEIPDGYEASIPGKDLWMTLDIDLQLAVEQVLGASQGAIVAMDPRNGDILALASNPTFDPNVFVQRRRMSERAEALRNQFNLALNGVYAPGSVFKIVMATAILEEGVMTPKQEVVCLGRIPVGRGYKHCHVWWKFQWGHGAVDLPTALQRSCNIYFFNTSIKLGHETIIRYARDVFGLIDQPKFRYRAEGEEEPFTLVGEDPDPGRVLRARLMKGRSHWFYGDTLNLAVGQGEIATTPLQTAVLMSVVAMRGTMYQPRLVTQVTDFDGSVLQEFPEKIIQKANLKPITIDTINDGLRRVMNTPRGTGYRSRVEGLDVLGKTGTAEKGSEGTDAWFACFATLDVPEIALVVVFPNAGHGSDVAAPAASEVLKAYYGDRLLPKVTRVESLEARL